MRGQDMHDSLYREYGNILFQKEEHGILLKKRYGSVVYCPGHSEKEPGAMYPRCICLAHNGEKNGALLATFECYSHELPVFPIYESLDEGKSWEKIGQVEDTQLNWGCRYQPHLFELPVKCGDLEAGTVLCAGNIIPHDYKKTALHLYKSCDGGRNWEFVSEIASGGEAFVDIKGIRDEDRPVWEPFLELTRDNRLICFFSDERLNQEKGFNQLLAHKVSPDGGRTWGEEKIDVAFPNGVLRPGMPVIARTGSGKLMMVYEMINQDSVPVYFRISDNMEDWGETDFLGNRIVTEDGSSLTGTPYITWIPQGGPEGTFLASGRGFSHILTNSEGGRGYWHKMDRLIETDNSCPSPGYSQCLVSIKGGKNILNLCPRQISPGLSMIEAAVADVYVKS